MNRQKSKIHIETSTGSASDALTDILRSVRMEGSVFSRASLSAPFGVESGDMTRGVFHAVVQGNPWARLAKGGDPVELSPGDVIIFPFGDNHLITNAPDSAYRPMAELASSTSGGMGRLVVDGGGARTSLICGHISFESDGAHPVFSMLPPMIHVKDNEGSIVGVAETLIGLIAGEVDNPSPGSETVVARLTDVLIVLILRAYVRDLEPGEGGWLGALKDPGIREAIGQIHRHPDHPWTAAELAQVAGMSRSAFFARFKSAVGETPADYLSRWRIHLAARQLRGGDVSVAAAGRSVGYQTEAAFSNAFLRVMGIRPGAYRAAA